MTKTARLKSLFCLTSLFFPLKDCKHGLVYIKSLNRRRIVPFTFLLFLLLFNACRKDPNPPAPDKPNPEFDGYWNVTENVTIAFNSSFHSSSSFVGKTVSVNDSVFATVQKRNKSLYPWSGFMADSIFLRRAFGDTLYNDLQGKMGRCSHNFDTLDFTYLYGLGAVVYEVTQHWVKNPLLTEDSFYRPPPQYDHPFFNDSVASILIGAYASLYNVGDTGTLIWKTHIDGATASPPVPLYENGNVFVSGKVALKAVDYATGNEKWHKPMDNQNGFRAYLSLDDNKLYAVKYSLNAYDIANGNLISSDSSGNYGTTGPYIQEHNAFFGDATHAVCSFNCVTRTVNWKYNYLNIIQHSSFVTALPVVVNDVAYFVSEDGTVFALNAGTGAFKWKAYVGPVINSNPVVKNGILYIGSDDFNMYALDAANGNLLWKFQTDFKVESTVFVDNGSVYFGSEDQKVYSLNALTGQKNWEYLTYNVIFNASPVVVNNVVYIGSGRNLYAIDCTNGKRIWICEVGDESTSPCVITKSKRAVSAFTER